jgi:hypothetical protein
VQIFSRFDVCSTSLCLLNNAIIPSGERPLPTTRLEEIMYALQELANLIIHSETASVLPLHPYLRSGLSDDEDHEKRPHLLALFPSFCELIITR